ncbi:MAG TPA: sulfotransferase domain-containing protein [Euzebya sp.]|nr:sulfotransferase domain-containing protein [Euzebya sp.]
MINQLPNLVIAGVAKGGTTSLFRYLGQHDDICASQVKELDYYAPLRRPGGQLPPLEEYTRHFTHCGGQRYRMEASPSYCYAGSPVIAAVQQTLDQPGIVISLRDPVARFWSAYTFLQSMGRLPRDMTCEDYITSCEERGRADGQHTPLSVGRYVDYVPNWLEGFGADLRIIFAEHLFTDPAAVVAELLRWLEIAPSADSFDYGMHNPTQMPRNRLVATWAYRAKAVSDRALERAPRLRATLRSAYRRVNTRADHRSLPEGARARLEAYYAGPTGALADALSAHGVTDLPRWLNGGT